MQLGFGILALVLAAIVQSTAAQHLDGGPRPDLVLLLVLAWSMLRGLTEGIIGGIAGGLALDLRGLDPPEPMVAILGLIDSGEAGPVLIAHLDREPIFLYPELDDRGWAHEVLPSACGEANCEHEVRLRIVRVTA